MEVELQPGFEFQGKRIRKISYSADFKILADSKEQTTEQSREQSTEHLKEQSKEQMTEHLKEQTTEQSKEQMTEHLKEQSTEQSTEQSREQSREQMTEHLWVDMKGMETEIFKLKWKLLLFRGVHVHKVKSVSALVTLLLEQGFLPKPATKPATTP